jgi:hypothetical protein
MMGKEDFLGTYKNKNTGAIWVITKFKDGYNQKLNDNPEAYTGVMSPTTGQQMVNIKIKQGYEKVGDVPEVPTVVVPTVIQPIFDATGSSTPAKYDPLSPEPPISSTPTNTEPAESIRDRMKKIKAKTQGLSLDNPPVPEENPVKKATPPKTIAIFLYHGILFAFLQQDGKDILRTTFKDKAPVEESIVDADVQIQSCRSRGFKEISLKDFAKYEEQNKNPFDTNASSKSLTDICSF